MTTIDKFELIETLMNCNKINLSVKRNDKITIIAIDKMQEYENVSQQYRVVTDRGYADVWCKDLMIDELWKMLDETLYSKFDYYIVEY